MISCYIHVGSEALKINFVRMSKYNRSFSTLFVERRNFSSPKVKYFFKYPCALNIFVIESTNGENNKEDMESGETINLESSTYRFLRCFVADAVQSECK